MQEVRMPQGFSIYEGSVVLVEEGWLRVSKIQSVKAGSDGNPQLSLEGDIFEDYDDAVVRKSAPENK